MITSIIAIGILSTLFMDLMALCLRKGFGVTGLDYRLLGRWLLYMRKGVFSHQNIVKTLAHSHEKIIGWTVHYLIGIIFSFVLVLIQGESWITSPQIIPALLLGILTTLIPFLIMQPAFGFGIAASKLPSPNIFRFKSLLAHFNYGLGLYLSAIVLSSMT